MHPERMKKALFIFGGFCCLLSSVTAMAAVNVKSSGIKKAAPVATKQTDKMTSATSMLPAVIGLVGSIRALNTQQQQLSAECAPTSDEISVVNNLVKEWARIGDSTSQSAVYGLGSFECTNSYSSNVQDFDDGEACYETFSDAADKGMVWEGFPKASSAKKCEDGNSKKCQNVSNIYDVFAKIPFSDEDYTIAEANKITAFKQKAEKCSPARIKAAKRELYGNFLVQTLNSVGQTTGAAGTASVLQAVQSMGGSGDLKSILPSLGQMALQGLDK